VTAPPQDPTATGPRVGPRHPDAGPAILTLRDVTVDYAGRVAVDRVSVTVAPGGWTALIGPNGAGKTSLLHAVTGAVPCGGALSVGHEDLTALPSRVRARRVALVPQRPVMPADMRVADYVLLGRTAHLPYLGVETAHDRRVVAETLERLDLGGLVRRPVGKLSGGEQQRVVLARALAQQTPVLLLDEPTSALDETAKAAIESTLRELRDRLGLSLVLVTHDLDQAERLADRILVLEPGALREASTAAAPDR
jgi:iron complex transport system ATP-binding protein